MDKLEYYVKNGFYYELVDRKGDWVIFKQRLEKGRGCLAFEVFKIHISKEMDGTFKNKVGEEIIVKFAPKECGPSNEAFGASAWSVKTLERAYEKRAEAMAREIENKEKRDARNK